MQLIDDDERLRSYDKDQLQEFTVLTESPMPAYGDLLDDQELADLLGVSRFPERLTRRCGQVQRRNGSCWRWS